MADEKNPLFAVCYQNVEQEKRRELKKFLRKNNNITDQNTLQCLIDRYN